MKTTTVDDLVDYFRSSLCANGETPVARWMPSTSRAYIRFRVTLSTTDTSKTPKVTGIRLYVIPKSPYEKVGYARPVVLDSNDAWKAVPENAYTVITPIFAQPLGYQLSQQKIT